MFAPYYRGQTKAGTGQKMLFVPFVFSNSRFQLCAFRCEKIVVIVTLLEVIEGIPDRVGGTKISTTFTRDYFMSENLRGPALKKRPTISGSKMIFISQVEVTEHYLKMNFFCFSFALNQKYRAANIFPPIAAKSG